MTTVSEKPPVSCQLSTASPAQQDDTKNGEQLTTDKLTFIRRGETDEQICVLTFDRPNSSANVFDKATLLELNEHLTAITADSRLKGLVLISAKKSIFIAGADLHSFSRAKTPHEIQEMIELGQSVFNRIAGLSIPTVAAIHGACVGGGYEICLACDYRIASPERVTKIGLPETQLGILPAWGGSTRLPRLIGVPKALDVILAGRTLAAKQAIKCGMVDELAPREYLLSIACKKIVAGRTSLRRRPSLALAATNNALTVRLIAKRARAETFKKTRGHYPAISKALEVVTQGISKSVATSLALERNAIIELAQTEACKNLIRVFFLQERAKKLLANKHDNSAESTPPTKRIAVIGAGVMGAGIAQWASARELQVVLRDVNAEQVAKGMATIAQLYEQGLKRRAFTKIEARAGMDRIAPAASEVPLKNVDLIIEAAVENMDLKKDIFRRLDEQAGPGTILATNTSALSISEIAAATKHPDRVIGIHFFNPVHRMQLVEVVVGQHTRPDVIQRSVRFVQQTGKLPVVVKDSPGFLVNRILMPYLIEAGHLFECGARVEDIDEAMLDFGMPMGPLRLIDEVGVDVAHHVAETIAAKFSSRLGAPQVLHEMFEAGLLGRKNGRGFYVHTKGSKEPDVNPNIDKFQQRALAATLSRAELQSRMVLLMLNEAARCLEEKVVAEPADVDFAMIMGTGFAPFLGGPLRFADYVGIPQLVEELDKLATKEAPRFAPCGLLQTMAAKGKTFYEEKGMA
jgi:3-hydroxyacyl-CoA dehydrogenase/enoyl-CoA hydratase/3-hydroxybutyryl-CoA epimerase